MSEYLSPDAKRFITLRTGFDLLIATVCIEHRHHRLHDDQDFEPLVEHLGLKTI